MNREPISIEQIPLRIVFYDFVLDCLQANVMLEYPLDEAIDIVNENLSQVVQSETTLSEDLLFLRDQITTTEVSMARVYNYNVEKKQKANAAAAGNAQVVTQAA